MSTDVDLVFKYGRVVSVVDFISALLEGGWAPTESWVLEPVNFESSAWTMLDSLSISDLRLWAERFDCVDGGCGFSLGHNETGIGGVFLFFENRTEISFSVTRNVPYLDGVDGLVDFSACCKPLFTVMRKASVFLSSIEINQFVG